MRLTARDGSELWLTYCMNVHPGGTIATTLDAIEQTVLPLRKRLGHAGPFGLGLRLSEAGLEDKEATWRAVRRLQAACSEHDLVPFTANAVVLGDFHGQPVKESVYAPPWSDPARLAYTNRFANTLGLLGAGLAGPEGPSALSLSTAPLTWGAWDPERATQREAARALAACAERLRSLSEVTGVPVRLALEPEPGCQIQTVAEAIAFFTGPLAEALSAYAPAARDHLGLCYDVCHQAVVDEDPDAGLDALAAAGVRVVKVQASCALEVTDPNDEVAREAVSAFDEPVYLHQVGASDADGRVHVAADLPMALADAAWRERAPWRVHFHVPVFREAAAGSLATTRPFLERVLARVAAGGVTDHLEIETYTWDVLPEAERQDGSGSDLVEALALEYESVLATLEAHGVTREGGA